MRFDFIPLIRRVSHQEAVEPPYAVSSSTPPV